jgi:hypothetical protein
MNTDTDETTTEQLTLLPQPEVPLRFRLDEATRRRGLQHVAEIRRMLASSTATTTAVAGGGRARAAPGSRRAA